MNEITIRLAVLDDWPTIVDFNCRLAEESEELLLDRRRVEPGVRALLADGHKGRYFVACLEGGRIVGQMMHTWEWSDWRNGQIWWLQSVYVAPEFRRRGVFRRLFEHLSNQAAADPEVVGLRLYVDERNQAAQEVYCELGLHRSTYLVMERLRFT